MQDNMSTMTALISTEQCKPTPHDPGKGLPLLYWLINLSTVLWRVLNFIVGFDTLKSYAKKTRRRASRRAGGDGVKVLKRYLNYTHFHATHSFSHSDTNPHTQKKQHIYI